MFESTCSLDRIMDFQLNFPDYLTVSTATSSLPPPTSDTLPLAVLCMTETNKA